LERWRNGDLNDQRKGAAKHVANKLSDDEARIVVETACCEEYRDKTPMEIVPLLAEIGLYLASESTFYRLLKARSLLHHRTNSAPTRRNNRPPELAATAPNQVWSWDITYIRTLVAGIYFYAYVFLDIFSRKIVAWEISEIESDTVSANMMERLRLEFNLRGVHLHSDRGNPMKGSTMVMKLFELGIIPSLSRPRVSDDNPYSESLFRTIKYDVSYPGKFDTIAEAREWFAGFINWYNTEHLHSGIGYVTPASRHDGTAQAIYEKRNATYAIAREKHPERWSSQSKKWQGAEVVYLNPSDETKKRMKEKEVA